MFSISTVLPSRLRDLVDQVDLEADELAGGVLELPRHVADIGADREVGGPGGAGCPGQREGGRGREQRAAGEAIVGHWCIPRRVHQKS